MQDEENITQRYLFITQRYSLLARALDERQRRLLVAAEAKAIGRGGIAVVADATGVSRQTIRLGLSELSNSSATEAAGNDSSMRVRKAGGGRKRAVENDVSLLADLEGLIEPVTYGNLDSPLRWTCKSLRILASELKALGHNVSHVVVGALLKANNYNLQPPAKMIECREHPDRKERFACINAHVTRALAAGEPVIHVDNKKKKLVGRFKIGGREWRKQGELFEVNLHDIADPKSTRADTHGIHDMGADHAWVNVETDNDTDVFAADCIRRWWLRTGAQLYPNAAELTITTDGGRNNRDHVSLWKRELQKLANEIDIMIRVYHFPPCTRKWREIESRYFSSISMNLRDQPLVSHDVLVNLVANGSRSGMDAIADLDGNIYPDGIIDSEEEFTNTRVTYSGEWSYRIRSQYK